jgi:hypothetical protein
MRKKSSSHLDRLAALPALLLVAYTLFTQPVGGSLRGPFPTVASQLHAEPAGGRANMVRPEHMQMCSPDAFGAGRRDKAFDSFVLLPATAVAAPAAAGAVQAATHAAPTVRCYRTHNPRDPPSYA